MCPHSWETDSPICPECGADWTDYFLGRKPIMATLQSKAEEVLAGHQPENIPGTNNAVCRECGMIFPCHAWLLANEILQPCSGE